MPVQDAINQVDPFLAPYSTQHTYKLAQTRFLTRTQLDKTVMVGFKNPGEDAVQEVEMTPEPEVETLITALEFQDPPIQPIEARILEPSGLGYLRITDFGDDYHLTAKLWERYIKTFQDYSVPGIILDLRKNNGGNGQLALYFAGYFFDREIELSRRSYYNGLTGKLEYTDKNETIDLAPAYFEGPV